MLEPVCGELWKQWEVRKQWEVLWKQWGLVGWETNAKPSVLAKQIAAKQIARTNNADLILCLCLCFAFAAEKLLRCL